MTQNIMSVRQTTIASKFIVEGAGVHSGAPVALKLCPAASNSGIVFKIINDDGRVARIRATSRAVRNVTLCTIIGNGDGAQAATVEHLMSAIHGLGIDNMIIEMKSGEVPIMDGSAAPFIDALLECGLKKQNARRRYIKVLKKVRVEDGNGWAEFSPHKGFALDVEIDFDNEIIGRQRLAMEISPQSYVRELAPARTFGFMRDVERLWANGRALGASLDNTVAIGEDGIINPEGLRYRDEFVRHKAMDAVGDLALAGAPLLAAYRSYCGGHALNQAAVKALLDDSEAWEWAEMPPRKARRHQAYAESGLPLMAGLAASRS